MADEHTRLTTLWDQVKPLTQPCNDILRSIIALEICNWNLENSILSLCKAIGTKSPPELKIGHSDSITDERWKKVWAYYLTLKKWLPHRGRNTGYEPLLRICDPKGTIQKHILEMLGESTELKQLYVERFCLNLGYWLGGFYSEDSSQLKTYNAAVEQIEKELLKLDPDSKILEWMRLDGKKEWIEICHHKAFRRFDIQISSISGGKWREAIPQRGSDGVERAITLENYLHPIEDWMKGNKSSNDPLDNPLYDNIHKMLGRRDNEKLFLTSFLVSLLQSQQIAAKWRGEAKHS